MPHAIIPTAFALRKMATACTRKGLLFEDRLAMQQSEKQQSTPPDKPQPLNENPPAVSTPPSGRPLAPSGQAPAPSASPSSAVVPPPPTADVPHPSTPPKPATSPQPTTLAEPTTTPPGPQSPPPRAANMVKACTPDKGGNISSEEGKAEIGKASAASRPLPTSNTVKGPADGETSTASRPLPASNTVKCPAAGEAKVEGVKRVEYVAVNAAKGKVTVPKPCGQKSWETNKASGIAASGSSATAPLNIKPASAHKGFGSPGKATYLLGVKAAATVSRTRAALAAEKERERARAKTLAEKAAAEEARGKAQAKDEARAREGAFKAPAERTAKEKAGRERFMKKRQEEDRKREAGKREPEKRARAIGMEALRQAELKRKEDAKVAAAATAAAAVSVASAVREKAESAAAALKRAQQQKLRSAKLESGKDGASASPSSAVVPPPPTADAPHSSTPPKPATSPQPTTLAEPTTTPPAPQSPAPRATDMVKACTPDKGGKIPSEEGKAEIGKASAASRPLPTSSTNKGPADGETSAASRPLPAINTGGKGEHKMVFAKSLAKRIEEMRKAQTSSKPATVAKPATTVVMTTPAPVASPVKGKPEPESGEDGEEEDPFDMSSTPDWARGDNLANILDRQFGGPNPPNPDKIFPEVPTCNLEHIFNTSNSKWDRTSSVDWDVGRPTIAERIAYNREMGYQE